MDRKQTPWYTLSSGTKTLNPKHQAVAVGNIEAVKQHLAAGADVNTKDEFGVTPLHNAVWEGHKEIAKLLISRGADVNVLDGDGYTPLDLAIYLDELVDSLEDKAANKEIVNLLRKHGGKTGEEIALKSLMPRLTYNTELLGFNFTAKDGLTYVVEVTQDFKQWGELETIKGTGKQIKFIDPRQPLVPFKRNFYRVKVVE